VLFIFVLDDMLVCFVPLRIESRLHSNPL